MTRHVYPTAAMIGDYARAAAGFVPATALLATVAVGPVATGIIAGFAALFALFGMRTALRHATPIEATETGLVASGPFAVAIPWAELDRMKLAYYSTQRDRRHGWMQLELRAGAATIRIDSRIEGFNDLVERSALASAAQGVELTTATAANLEALGIGVAVISGFAGMARGRA
jgi:hypothetical protein